MTTTLPHSRTTSTHSMDKMPNMQNLSLADDQSSTNSAGASGYATPSSDSHHGSSLPKDPLEGTRTPFQYPLPSCKPVPRPELTAEQNAKYAEVLDIVSNWADIPTTTARNSPRSPLTDSERMWLSRESILRYLRATNWITANAAKRLTDTLVWRREYGVETITAELVAEENETGKQIQLGFDNNARVCTYLSPGKQNTKKSARQIQHLVYMLERTVDMMVPGQETCALLIDFKGSTSGGSPSVGQGREVMTILQGHYPERLGRALISQCKLTFVGKSGPLLTSLVPWFITTFFKLISPFIDPVTKEKMVFNPDLTKYVPVEQLDKEHGGAADFVYDHKVYWPALDKICAQRRAEYTRRWVAGGKMIGEYEAYIRGGDHKSLAELSRGASNGQAVAPV